MKRLLLYLSLVILFLGCSDDATGPTTDNDGDDPSETFEVAWTPDAGRAASAEVTAAGGGTVSATDADGVTWTLTVPPGALGGDTIITITPFASLSIEGPGMTICEGCTPPDTLCCVRGALFEPAGLGFDTTVVLRLHYPLSVPMPPDTMGRIVLLGNDPVVYAPCSTAADAGTRTIETGISHFSGYGTDAPNCDRLTTAFIETLDRMIRAEGTEFFYMAAGDMWSLRQAGFHCDGYGVCVEVCPGISEGVESWIELASADHGSDLQSLFADMEADWTTIDGLVRHVDATDRLAASCPAVGRSGLRRIILGIILEKAGVMADAAWNDCQNNRCEEGRAALEALVDLADRGYIVDGTFVQLLRGRADDCCGGYQISLSVNNPNILRAIINPGDEAMCSATLMVTLKTSSGEPVPDTYVGLESDFILNGVTTDENGVGLQYVSTRDLGYGDRFGCAQYVTKEIIANFYDSDNSLNYYSDPVTLTFQNFVVSTTVTYNYSFDEYEDAENYGSGSGSVTGGSWNYANSNAFYPCDGAAEGVIRRSYSSSGCSGGECGESALIDGLEYSGCLIRPNLESVTLDNGKTTSRLVSLSFNTLPVPGQGWMEMCKEGECDTNLVYLSSWMPWPTVPSLWECVDGVIEPLTWSMSSDTENATLSLIIEATY